MRKTFILVATLTLAVGLASNFPGFAPIARADSTPPAGVTGQNNAVATPTPLKDAWLAQKKDQQVATVGFTAATFIAAALLLWVATRTEILRDSVPSDFGTVTGPNGKKLVRPFSLAQSQMAWWFYLVLVSYVYLYLIKGEPSISGQALTLIGIGTGTALGAAMVQNTKLDPNLARFVALPPLIAAATPQDALTLGAEYNALAIRLSSKGFLHDVLTDAYGISLHRFQSFVWTAVLGAIFLIEVAVHRAMPSFDANSLALLGISGGAYLGFKIPEQPT